MMPVRYSAMNKTTGTGPSSMMAAIMVTAATCNQNEKIEKQTTIYPEDANKLKVPNTGNSYAEQIKEKENFRFCVRCDHFMLAVVVFLLFSPSFVFSLH